MISLVFMCIFIAISLGILGFGVFKAIKIARFPMPKSLSYPSEIKKFLYLSIGAATSTVLIFVFLAKYQEYPMVSGDWAQLIFGSLIFGFTLSSFIFAFIVHYYGKEIDKTSDKVLFISIIASGFTFFLGLLLLTNGLADYVTYPLVNGINFKQGFVTPATLSTEPPYSYAKPNIAWYAVCILAGAALVYVICDHRFYVEYGKHGILESTFFVAFPAGLIGARLGYVIGEWEHGGFATRVANGQWWSIFAVWEGGLTVISGALVGIIAGVLWFIWRNKKYNVLLAMDVIIPTILVAQALGRWGNFFNCEVHGGIVETANWWMLPKMVINNAAYSEGHHVLLPNGYMFLPLFYVECLTNLFGYALIRFGIGKGLRKYLELGDLSMCYIIWYGLTRVILEPFRDPDLYNMGNDGYYSWIWSIVFVIAGSFAILGNHIFRYFLNKYKKANAFKNVNKPLTIGVGSSILAAGLAMLIIGSVFMTQNIQSPTLEFNKFNNGLIILSVGLSLIIFACVAVIYLFSGKKKQSEE